MDNFDIHAEIRKTFQMRSRFDNLPLTARVGTRDRLALILGKFGYNRCAEVGVYRGQFSRVLCEANPNIELTCIDSWLDKAGRRTGRSDRIFNSAVKRLSGFNVKFIRKYSMDALCDFEDGSLDFVYIDANHTFDFCCPDIIYWSKKVRSGGIVGCHDYCNFTGSGVVKAVDAYTHCHRIDPWYATRELLPTAFWIKP